MAGQFSLSASHGCWGIATILALEGKLQEGVAGTLLGAIAGYLFGKWPTKPDSVTTGEESRRATGQSTTPAGDQRAACRVGREDSDRTPASASARDARLAVQIVAPSGPVGVC